MSDNKIAIYLDDSATMFGQAIFEISCISCGGFVAVIGPVANSYKTIKADAVVNFDFVTFLCSLISPLQFRSN